jgi:hypothetical protein
MIEFDFGDLREKVAAQHDSHRDIFVKKLRLKVAEDENWYVKLFNDDGVIRKFNVPSHVLHQLVNLLGFTTDGFTRIAFDGTKTERTAMAIFLTHVLQERNLDLVIRTVPQEWDTDGIESIHIQGDAGLGNMELLDTISPVLGSLQSQGHDIELLSTLSGFTGDEDGASFTLSLLNNSIKYNVSGRPYMAQIIISNSELGGMHIMHCLYDGESSVYGAGSVSGNMENAHPVEIWEMLRDKLTNQKLYHTFAMRLARAMKTHPKEKEKENVKTETRTKRTQTRKASSGKTQRGNTEATGASKPKRKTAAKGQRGNNHHPRTAKSDASIPTVA